MSCRQHLLIALLLGALLLALSTVLLSSMFVHFHMPSTPSTQLVIPPILPILGEGSSGEEGEVEKGVSSSSSFPEVRLELPEACRSLSPQHHPIPSGKSETDRYVNSVKQITVDVEGVLPSYLYNVPIENFQPMVLSGYDEATGTVQRYRSPLRRPLPTNATLVCIPDGIVADNSLAGPYHDGATSPIFIQQNKVWYGDITLYGRFLQKSPTVMDIPGIGVQISGWTAFVANHFLLDSFVRLALVYDLLMSDEPGWRDAKIVIAADLIQEGKVPTDKNNLMKSYRVRHFVEWMYHKLNLTDRLVPNNGWIVKAKHTTRFEYLVLPDVVSQPLCGPSNNPMKDPVFPRGVLRPIQTALGSLATNPRRYLVYASRSDAGGRRAVELQRKRELHDALREVLKNRPASAKSSLELLDWKYTSPDETLEVFRQALIVMGPHGAQLWNGALSPPGGLMVEFNTWADMFTNEDCRVHGFSLSNAAGLDYALVETENFGYEKANLLPNVTHVVAVVEDFLDRHGY